MKQSEYYKGSTEEEHANKTKYLQVQYDFKKNISLNNSNCIEFHRRDKEEYYIVRN
jgi:hypothetical protein